MVIIIGEIFSAGAKGSNEGTQRAATTQAHKQTHEQTSQENLLLFVSRVQFSSTITDHNIVESDA